MDCYYVDLSYLKEFAKGNNATVIKYISMFQASAPALLRNMEVAMEGADANGVYAALHTLKPQLQFMGISKAHEKAEKGEFLLREKPVLTEEINLLIGEITDIINGALRELEASKTQFV